jgi:hypothetical protein
MLSETMHMPPPRVARRRELTYGRTEVLRPLPATALWLLHPANVLPMLACLAWIVLLVPFALLVAGGLLVGWLPVVILLAVLLAHYVNVLDDLGPEARHEVPPLLREASLSEDILRPVRRLWWATLLAFGPAVLAWQVTPVLAVPAAAGGLLAWPALVLTFVAGDSTLCNFAPHRLLAVARICGGGYTVVALFLTPLTLVTHAVAAIAVAELVASVVGGSIVRPTGVLPIGIVASVAAATSGLAVYCGHLLATRLADLHRHYHPLFPWLCQYHEREPFELTKSGSGRRDPAEV